MIDQKHVLADKFVNPSWVAHLAYSADMLEHMNALNKELQGKNIKHLLNLKAKQICHVFGCPQLQKLHRQSKSCCLLQQLPFANKDFQL